MDPSAIKRSNVISFERETFRAIQCNICGAKMFPESLLQAHLSNHRQHQRWLNGELRKLQDTFSRMRDIA